MKVNFKQQFVNFDGTPVNEIELRTSPEGYRFPVDTTKPMFLRKACVEALMGSYEDEKNLSGEEKERRYDLATKITSFDELDIKSEDITLLKTLINKAYGVKIVAQARKMLEGGSLT